MAAEINSDRRGTKLRHCRPVYRDTSCSSQLHDYALSKVFRYTGLRLVSGQWSLPRDNVLVSKSKAARASEIEENEREMLLVAFILFYFRRADAFKLRSHRIERCARTAR